MDPYSTYALLKVIEQQKTIPKFWIRFFPSIFLSKTDEIAIDKVVNDYKGLAPFVAPNVQGRVLKKYGYTTYSVAPAYLKPKDVLDPNTDLVRQAGQALAAESMDLMARRNAVAAWLVERQRILIDNRIEWMCLQVAVYGKVVVVGEDYPTQTVDFRRNAAHTLTLTTTARWSQGTATPAANVMAVRRTIQDTSGHIVKNVTFGANAWANFYAKEIAGKEATLSNAQVRGSDVEISFLADGFEGAEYMGRYRGSNGAGFDCWVYSAKYKDGNGTLVDMLNTDAVAFVDSGIEGIQAYGAIRDKRSGFRPMKYFPKNWEVEDPSEEYIMTQSAPLPIPGNTDATAMIQTN